MDTRTPGNAPWGHRAGILLVLCGMLLLLAGPIIPWFHTELLDARLDLSPLPPASLLEYLLKLLPENMSMFVGIALAYLILFLGTSLVGIRSLAAMAHHQDRRGEGGDAWVGVLASLCGAGVLGISFPLLNGTALLAWPSSRFMLDAGYFVTLVGFIVALVGNGCIVLARRKNTAPQHT